MPLKKSAGISHNISEMMHAGHPQDQAIAAALNVAREKRGGRVKVHKGPIHSSVAGRTDHLPMHVASGSYVIPADIISAMGEGNSMAGFKVAKSIFSIKGPYGQSTGHTPYGGSGLPYVGKAGGGGADSGQAANPHPTGGGGADSGQAANPVTQPQPVVHQSSGLAPAASPAPEARPSDQYTSLTDMFDGGGPGRSGDTFEGGPFSGALNAIGINPIGSGGSSSSSSPAQGGGEGKSFWSYALPIAGGLMGGMPGFLAGSSLYKTLGDTFSPKEDDTTATQTNTSTTPYATTTSGFARGGATDGVPIVAAGGEYVVSPEEVEHIGGGSMDEGHKILDAFVKKMRQKTIKTLQKLPGPQKD